MIKTLLSDLKKKLYIRSALISISSLEEILSVNDSLSADEILLEIIKKSLREFEQTNPLILDMKMNMDQLKSCSAPEGFGEIKSNFTLYLDCKISEDQIVLVPNSTPMYRTGWGSIPAIANYQYFTEYRKPYLFIRDIPSVLWGTNGYFYVRGICSRPVIPDFLGDKSFNTNSEKAAIYWLDIEEGFRGTYFLDLCMVNLLDFIRQLKASVQLPSIGIDIMGNVDNAYMELRSRCDQNALQSGWYGELII